MKPEQAFDLANPLHLRAEIARRGLAFPQLLPYEDAERGYIDPLDDPETRIAVRLFMGRIWQACLRAEEATDSESPQPRSNND